MQPQDNQPTSPEPTPQSPAPLQTSPTAQSNPVQPVAPQQQPLQQPQGPIPAAPAPQGTKRLIVAIIAAVVVVAGLAFLFLSPWSPFQSKIPFGPKLTVGEQRFVYACSAFDTDLVAKTLGINDDKNKQNVEETYAYAPDNKKDKSLDLLSLSTETSISSKCKLKLDRAFSASADGVQGTSFINVSASIQQYRNDIGAKADFQRAKVATPGAKTVAAYPTTSYYGAPAASAEGGPSYVQVNIVHKNVVLHLSAPLSSGDASGDKAAGHLGTIAQDVVKRIDEGEAYAPKDYSGYTKLNGNPLVDACRDVNYVNVANAIGSGTAFDPTLVNATYAYAPTDNNGATAKQISSNCTFSFRTQTEIDGQKDQITDAMNSKKDVFPTDGSPLNTESFSSKFPHYLAVQIFTTESNENSQKFLKQLKEETTKQLQKNAGLSAKAEDVKIGDGGVSVTTEVTAPQIGGDAQQPAASYDTQIYYVTDGPYMYLVSASFTRQSQPYKTTDQKFTQEQMQQIFKELTAARKVAEKVK